MTLQKHEAVTCTFAHFHDNIILNTFTRKEKKIGQSFFKTLKVDHSCKNIIVRKKTNKTLKNNKIFFCLLNLCRNSLVIKEPGGLLVQLVKAFFGNILGLNFLNEILKKVLNLLLGF